MDTLPQTLHDLTLADNAIRSKAELQYNELKNDAFTRLLLPSTILGVIANDASDISIRTLSVVLLRKLLVDNDPCLYYIMDEVERNRLMHELLSVTSGIQSKYHTIKVKLVDTIGEFATEVVDDEWIELFNFCTTLIQSNYEYDREAGFVLLGALSRGEHYKSRMLQSESSIASLLSVLIMGLADNRNEGRIIVSTVKSITILLTSLTLESSLDKFLCLLPHIIQSLILLIDTSRSTDDDDNLTCMAYAESLIEIAEEVGTFFVSKLDDVYCAIIALIETYSLNGPLRHMLIEFLVVLCTEHPKQCRKLKDQNGVKGYYLTRLLPTCTAMMNSIKDDPTWYTHHANEDDNNENNADLDVAESAIDRMCCSLGLKLTYPIISFCLSKLLTGLTWQEHHTGLRILGNYVELTALIDDKVQLQKHRNDVIYTLSSYSSNPHPRVRASAFESLCIFFYRHGKEVNKTESEAVLNLCLHGLDVSVNFTPKVRSSIVRCIIALTDRIPQSILELNISKLLSAVIQALIIGPVVVQELCIYAIISLAESIKGDYLAAHYDAVMPVLKQLLIHARSSGLESLWGQGLECCALLGESSGKRKFYPDAVEMMNTLITMQDQLDSESESKKYILKAWVRIARCLGVEFLPYLQVVIQKILIAVSQDVRAAGNIDLNTIDERSDIDVIEDNDGTLMYVRTSAVEEQASACQLLYLLIERLQENFYPYIEQSVNAITPLLHSPHEDVRSYCLATIPEVISAMAKGCAPDRVALKALSEYLIGELISCIQQESVVELIMTGLQSLKLSLQYCCYDWTLFTNKMKAGHSMPDDDPPHPVPSNCHQMLTCNQLKAVIQCGKASLRDSIQRRAILRAEAQVYGDNDEYDKAEEDIFMKDSMELHYNIAELFEMLFKTHGATVIPVYKEELHELVIEMSNPVCIKEDKQFSFYIIGSILEFGLDDGCAGDFFHSVVPLLLDVCQQSSSDSSLRQVCAYGLGIGCKMNAKSFAPFTAAALSALSISASFGQRDEATDNSVAAIGYILESVEAQGNFEHSAPLWGHWLSFQPLMHDRDEGRKVLEQLVRLATSCHKHIVSYDRQDDRISKLIFILATVYRNDDLSSADIDSKIAHLMKALVNLPDLGFVVQNSIANLKDAMRDSIARAIN